MRFRLCFTQAKPAYFYLVDCKFAGFALALLATGFDTHEHLRVVGELAHEEEQSLHGFLGLVIGQSSANELNLGEHPFGQDELLSASAALVDVYRRVDVHLRDSAAKYEFHVAGALELLEDEFIHAAVGFDEGCGEYGEGTCCSFLSSLCR